MAFLAWPAVVLILGLVAIFAFRASIQGFLNRATKLGMGRAAIEASPAPQEPAPPPPPSPADELLKAFDNALLLQREADIRTQLTQSKIDQPAEREKVLVRFLAGLSITLGFERAYAQIWGSQLAALQVLNSVPAPGIKGDALRPWYDQAATRYPAVYAAYSFDQWLGFLQSHSLITRTEDTATITLHGREFLKYLVHQGYPIDKLG